MLRLTTLVATAAVLTGTAVAGGDALDTPARASPLAQWRLITSIAKAGDQAVIAVGQRGHVLRSVDGGKSWTQSKVPLSSDLTAVQFVDSHVGYAVGHDGVVLRSVDGGASWVRVLDGRSANRLLAEYMQKKLDAAGSQADDSDRKLLEEARRNVELGPDKPFLDVWFSSADDGFVVGAYNLVFHTADGGKSWQPWFDRTDNPKLLNLYSIRPAHGTLYIAGEAGLLLKLDAAAQRFRALPRPYKGSYFGVMGTSAGVLAFGMRGNAFLSRDQGRHWSPVATGLASSITAGDVGAGGSVVLVDQAGNLARSDDGGADFARLALPAAVPLAAVAAVPGGAVAGGPRGLRTIAFGAHAR